MAPEAGRPRLFITLIRRLVRQYGALDLDASDIRLSLDHTGLSLGHTSILIIENYCNVLRLEQ